MNPGAQHNIIRAPKRLGYEFKNCPLGHGPRITPLPPLRSDTEYVKKKLEVDIYLKHHPSPLVIVINRILYIEYCDH